MLDFLDDLSDFGSNLYGKAVELGNEAIDSISLDVKDAPEKVTDKTKVHSDSKVPLPSWVENNKTALMLGGGVLGVIALIAFTRK